MHFVYSNTREDLFVELEIKWSMSQRSILYRTIYFLFIIP